MDDELNVKVGCRRDAERLYDQCVGPHFNGTASFKECSLRFYESAMTKLPEHMHGVILNRMENVRRRGDTYIMMTIEELLDAGVSEDALRAALLLVFA